MEYELIRLNTARNCLRYVIKAFNIKEIYLPFYICPSLRSAVFKERCVIKYYHIDENFFPTENFPFDSFIVYPDYFGVCSENIKILCKKYKNLIVDNAHAFFSKPVGIASFNSVRKFFPKIRNGAFLYISKVCDFDFSQDEYEYVSIEPDYSETVKNERMLDGEDIKYMSECTMKYFYSLDLKSEKTKLRKRFEDYEQKYRHLNLLKFNINSNDVPFGYPLLTKSTKIADLMAENFEKRGKIIFRYWNNLPESYLEKIFYKNLICL